MKIENKKIICVVLLGIILKMISFYKYREALYLHDALSLLIYFFVIFGDVFLSRVKKFVNGNAFVLATISFSVFIIISKFYIDITYVSQCSMLALCFMAILFNKEGKEYKNILHNLIHTFLIMIVFIFVFFVLGGTFSYKLSTLSLNTEEVNEVLLQEHIKELNEELE